MFERKGPDRRNAKVGSSKVIISDFYILTAYIRNSRFRRGVSTPDGNRKS